MVSTRPADKARERYLLLGKILISVVHRFELAAIDGNKRIRKQVKLLTQSS